MAGQVFPFFTALQLPDAPFKLSKPSDTCHLWCGLHLVQFLALLELPNCHIFRFYWLDNAGCFLETVQTLYLEARRLPPWLLLGHSSLPFASPQTPKNPRGSFDQALWPQAFVVRALKPAVCLHGPLLLGRSSLPFASQTPKIPRGSFDQALWPQAFVLKALKTAVCLHGPLLLGCSSLPFASPETPKIPRGSFDQALWPQAFVVRALKPAVCLHGPLLLGRSSLPFASPQTPKKSPRQLRPGTLATGICC